MKTTIKKLLFFGAIAGLVLSCSNNASQEPMKTTPTKEESKAQGQAFLKDNEASTGNILQIAIGSEDHSTLVAGVQAAELENVLANNGPLTVFAPNNAAFEKLPEGTLETLLKPENQVDLKKIITYHASPGTFETEDLKDGMKMFMATGHYLTINQKDDGFYIENAKILGSVKASNGVVHVIDQVLIP